MANYGGSLDVIVDDAEAALMPAAGVVMIIAVLGIVLALVYYLVSTIVALRRIADGLDEAIAGVGEIVEKSARQRGGDRHQRAARRRGRPARGPARQEGRSQRRDGPDRERLPRGGRRRTAQLPREHLGGRAAHRRGLHQGTLTLARLGREAPIAAASPADQVLRNVEGGSLAARLLYPNLRQTSPENLPNSPVIGTGWSIQRATSGPRSRLPVRRT